MDRSDLRRCQGSQQSARRLWHQGGRSEGSPLEQPGPRTRPGCASRQGIQPPRREGPAGAGSVWRATRALLFRRRRRCQSRGAPPDGEGRLLSDRSRRAGRRRTAGFAAVRPAGRGELRQDLGEDRTNNLFVREVLEVDMKIGVSGASGHLGKAVVSELLQRHDGHEVVAITRTPESVSGLAQGRFGDYDRPESLAKAYASLDRLLIIPTVDPVPGRRGVQNVAAIDAAVRAGVKHIVFMSAAGARQEEEPALGAPYWRGGGGLFTPTPARTTPRMNFYAESFAQQAQASLGQGVLTGLAENRVAFVARDDVAAAAAGILIGDGHAGATYNATGPARLSGAERTALIAEITGRPLAFRVITEAQLRAGLTQAGLPAVVVNTVVGIQASFAAGAFDVVTGDVERLGGRPPKPLREVLARALKAPSA